MDPSRTASLRRAAAAAALTANSSYFAECERDERGHCVAAGGGGVAAKLKRVGAAVGHAEHVAAEWVKDGVGAAVRRLPGPAQEVVEAAWSAVRGAVGAAFANFTAAQAMAERVAVARGATPEQAKRLRGTLSTIDNKTFEVFKVAAIAGAHAAHLPAVVSATIPIATASYLAYSTARNPLATARAAGELVGEAVGKLTRVEYRGATAGREHSRRLGVEALNTGDALGELVADAYEAHKYSDWYAALFHAALDAGLDAKGAARAAARVFASRPAPDAQPRHDDVAWFLGSPVGNAAASAARFAAPAFALGCARAYDDVRGGRVDQRARVEFVRDCVYSREGRLAYDAAASRAYAAGASPSAAADAVVGAHADGQLVGYSRLSVAHVELQPCSLACGTSAGLRDPMSALGLVPLQPGCRCAWRAVRVSNAKSFFAECPRDAKGHCEAADGASSPEPVPWQGPPPRVPRPEDVPLRPKGEDAQGKRGDEAEAMARQLGFKSLLPEGKRSHAPGEVEEKGSTVDLEWDDSGKAYELKMCQTTSSEYRLKAHLKEKEDKKRFCELNGKQLYTLVGVRDVSSGDVHFYASKEPGLTGVDVLSKKGQDTYHYLGVVRGRRA